LQEALVSSDTRKMATLHLPHPHVPHTDFDEHPWLLLPVALFTIVVLAVLLIGVSFALAKLLTGRAY
jgi:hypothetical protein